MLFSISTSSLPRACFGLPPRLLCATMFFRFGKQGTHKTEPSSQPSCPQVGTTRASFRNTSKVKQEITQRIEELRCQVQCQNICQIKLTHCILSFLTGCIAGKTKANIMRHVGLMFSLFNPDLRKIKSGLKTPPFLGHVGAMLGLCWVHFCPCWALAGHVGAMIGPS